MSRIAPRLVSVLVSGEGLEGFADAAPTSHLKVFLPAPGQDEPLLPEFVPEGQAIPDDARPSVRTYTPRRFDAASGTLEIQFVLHGVGPASEWAERASAGDKLVVAGPGGRFVMDLRPSAGGSPATRARSRRSRRCSRRCPPRRPLRCTSR